MFPTLPQNDPNPAARQAQLHRAQADYQFQHVYCSDDYPDGVSLAAQLPVEQNFDLAYLAKVLPVDATLLANQAAVDLEYFTGDLEGGFSLSDWLGLTRAVGNQHFFFSQPTKAASRLAQSFPLNVEKYKALYALIRPPEIVGLLSKDQATRDRAFAWQRVAGVNPLVLRGITQTTPAPPAPPLPGGLLPPPPPGQLPASFPITEAIYQQVMGSDDSLARAAAERRLYLADYRLMMNLPQSEWDDGVLAVPRSRYLYAPLALFAQPRSDRADPLELRPVAIQCQQLPPEAGATHADNPIFTPLDSWRWQMACTVVQCADGVIQEMVYHLGHTHLVIEAAIVAAQRHLAKAHPLMVLLTPHFQFTLAINDYASKNLIAPGGQVDKLFGTSLEGSLTALVRGMQEYDFSQAAPPAELAARLVDDTSGLATYPYRDDALRVWLPLQRFVQAYLQLYYSTDGDVQNDRELQAFITTFGDPAQGNIKGVPSRIETREQLAGVVATLIFVASAQHSALNYAQFPMMGYAPNVTGALYAAAPTASTPQNQLNWLEMLPPANLAMQQFAILYQLSTVRFSVLGHYPPLHFEDRRVDCLVKQFQRELTMAETAMREADQYRFMSYPYLYPSEIGSSIFI